MKKERTKVDKDAKHTENMAKDEGENKGRNERKETEKTPFFYVIKKKRWRSKLNIQKYIGKMQRFAILQQAQHASDHQLLPTTRTMTWSRDLTNNNNDNNNKTTHEQRGTDDSSGNTQCHATLRPSSWHRFVRYDRRFERMPKPICWSEKLCIHRMNKKKNSIKKNIKKIVLLSKKVS